MDGFKNTFGKITNSLGKTSSDIIKRTKVSAQIINEEEKLRALYYDIGKKVHDIYKYGGSLGDAFDDIYNQLMKQEKIIKNLIEEKNKLSGTTECYNCKSTISKDDIYCPNCGEKFNENIKPIKINNFVEPVVEEKNIELEKNLIENSEGVNNFEEKDKICKVCSYKNSYDTEFCKSCGRKL